MKITWEEKELLSEKEIGKDQIIGICILVIVLLAVLSVSMYFIGRNSKISSEILIEQTAKNEKIIKYEEKISEQSMTILENDEKIKSQQQDFDDLKNYKENKENLDSEIEEKQKSIDSLNKDIETKQSTLDKLQEDIIRVKSEPISIPAGEHTVGDGIPAGRYSVTGSSNFVVRSSYGDLKVNTILGGGYIGVDSYVCNLENGDNIKASSACQLTPVE